MPGRKWYVVAALIFASGMVACAVFVILQVLELRGTLQQIVVPGTHELVLEERGGYTIFHESESAVDGRVYRVDDISGLAVSVESVATGASVVVTSPGTSSSYDLGGRSGRSVLAFHIDEPGPYRLTAGYDDGADGPDTVLAVGRGFGRKLAFTIVGGIVLALVSAFLALGLAVYTFVQRYRAARRARPPQTAAGGTPPVEALPVVPPRVT